MTTHRQVYLHIALYNTHMHSHTQESGTGDFIQNISTLAKCPRDTRYSVYLHIFAYNTHAHMCAHTYTHTHT